MRRHLVLPTLLILAVLAAGCTGGRGSPGPAATTPEPPIVTSPPPSALEGSVLAAFGRVGIEGRIAEHGFEDATVYGTWEGAEVFVHAYRSADADLRATPATVVGEDQVRGLPVVLANSEAFGLLRIVTCGSITYEVSAPGKDQGQEVKRFLAAFVKAARCEGV